MVLIYKNDIFHSTENLRPITIRTRRELYQPIFNHVRNVTTKKHINFQETFCTTQLITNTFNSHSQDDLIYSDFSKAFVRKLELLILMNTCVLILKAI